MEHGLPPEVSSALDEFVAAAVAALGADLVSITLFGSAAEGRLRRTSDVNVLVVLKRDAADGLARLRDDARRARLRIGLEAMLVLEGELGEAAAAFAEKFADARTRRRVLHGADSLAGLEIPADALRARLLQSLLNLSMRLRRSILELPAAGDRAAGVLSDVAGGVRACAHALLLLEGTPAPTPREALERVADGSAGPMMAVMRIHQARETSSIAASEADATLRELLQLAEAMRRRAQAAGASGVA